jgi:hypothetical protein
MLLNTSGEVVTKVRGRAYLDYVLSMYLDIDDVEDQSRPKGRASVSKKTLLSKLHQRSKQMDNRPWLRGRSLNELSRFRSVNKTSDRMGELT